MKKKLLTVALAATMVFSSVFSAFAETKSELTVDAGFSANSGNEVMEGNFDVTYTFHNASTDTAEAWFNFAVELFNGSDYITLRADAFGVGVAGYADDLGTWGQASKITWTGTPSDWTNFKADMADADVTVNIVRVGKVITVKYDIVAGENKYSFVGTTPEIADLADSLSIHLTGEKVELTNIVFKVNPSPVADENPETDPAQPSSGSTEQTTTAKGETTTTNGSVDTGKTETETTAKKEESSTNGSATTTDTTVDAVVSESEAADIQKAAKVEGMKDTLVVKAVDASSADFKVVAKAIGDKVKFAVVDLTLASGKQPVAGTKVTLPLMQAIKDAKFVKVSAIKDGKMETVAIVKVADGKITFEPKHFSTYVFSEATEAEFNAANTDSSKTNTGDSTTVAMTLAIAAVAAGAVVVARAKRKENA